MTPAIEKPAPEFEGMAVVNGEFKNIKLSDYKGKYVVLFFYPLDFTFVCPTEIIAFSDAYQQFKKINCELIAASTDSHFSHLAWINTPRNQGGLGTMKIPLLADKSCKIAKAYGVLNEDTGVPYRGLFIIDDKQNLRQITVNDLPVGRSVDETFRLVQAFQFTDEHGEEAIETPSGASDSEDSALDESHAGYINRMIYVLRVAAAQSRHKELSPAEGETMPSTSAGGQPTNKRIKTMCPAGWKPGSKTIKPTPSDSMLYFSDSSTYSQ